MTSLQEVLPMAWEGYQNHFIHANGRVVRPHNQHDSVSEGQAYALLLAVAFDDQFRFHQVLDWTERNLSRSERFGDRLLAWHWEVGKGVTDWNSATDAEVDIALALLLASQRWKDHKYREKAERILQDILELETQVIGEYRYLLPGNWGRNDDPVLINPSYFSPAHFRLFFQVTGDKRWQEVLQTTYLLLRRLPLEKALGVRQGLVPDWIGVDREQNLLPVEGYPARATWDAVRMPWRVALDVLWANDPHGREYLQHVVEFFTQEWEQRDGRFFLEYRLTGEPLAAKEQVGSYAMALPAFWSMNSRYTPALVEKILSRFQPKERCFSPQEDYYQNSLSLLGLLTLARPTESSHVSLISLLGDFSLQQDGVSNPEVVRSLSVF